MTLPLWPTKSQLCFKKQDDTSREPIREQLCFKKQDDALYIHTYIKWQLSLHRNKQTISNIYMLPLREMLMMIYNESGRCLGKLSRNSGSKEFAKVANRGGK